MLKKINQLSALCTSIFRSQYPIREYPFQKSTFGGLSVKLDPLPTLLCPRFINKTEKNTSESAAHTKRRVPSVCWLVLSARVYMLNIIHKINCGCHPGLAAPFIKESRQAVFSIHTARCEARDAFRLIFLIGMSRRRRRAVPVVLVGKQ